jgi:hypothetical protein
VGDPHLAFALAQFHFARVARGQTPRESILDR